MMKGWFLRIERLIAKTFPYIYYRYIRLLDTFDY